VVPLERARDLAAAGGDSFTFAVSLFDWTIVVLLAWIALFLSLRIPAVAKNGALFGLLFALLMVWLGNHAGWKSIPPLSNRVTSISIGGAYGTILLLNVWGIVWPAQKRFLRWCRENPGVPPPPDLQARLRRALLVSRASFWLTFPILFLMAAASHFPLFVR